MKKKSEIFFSKIKSIKSLNKKRQNLKSHLPQPYHSHHNHGEIDSEYNHMEYILASEEIMAHTKNTSVQFHNISAISQSNHQNISSNTGLSDEQQSQQTIVVPNAETVDPNSESNAVNSNPNNFTNNNSSINDDRHKMKIKHAREKILQGITID
jgi:hypothetical protein